MVEQRYKNTPYMKTTLTEALIVGAIGVVATTLHMVWLLKDDRTPNHTVEDRKIKRYWHLLGGVLHLWIGYVMERAYGQGMGLLTAAMMWNFFDGAINTWVLRKEWWNIGSTALLDIAQAWLGKWLKEDPRTVSAVLKITLLLAAIVNVLFST